MKDGVYTNAAVENQGARNGVSVKANGLSTVLDVLRGAFRNAHHHIRYLLPLSGGSENARQDDARGPFTAAGSPRRHSH